MKAKWRAFLELAGNDGVVIATFGDMMRVPGPKGATLKTAKAEGARVEVVYSAFDALKLATENKGRHRGLSRHRLRNHGRPPSRRPCRWPRSRA